MINKISKTLQKHIVNWHLVTFPDCTLHSQVEKLCEELQELNECPKKYEELADCLIVCSILSNRYNNALGDFVADILYKKYKNFCDIERIVTNKMNINLMRKWEMKDGKYRHR